MVALGLIEVAIVPDAEDFDTYGKLNGPDRCGYYDANITPFPTYDDPNELQQAVSSNARNKVVKYIEVTNGTYYQFDLVLNKGFDFTDCDSLIYELFVNGKRKEGVFAEEERYMEDNEVGSHRWASCCGGVRTGPDHSLKIHRFRFNLPQRSRDEFGQWASVLVTLKVEVRRFRREGLMPRREAIPNAKSQSGVKKTSKISDAQPILMAGENHYGQYVGKDRLAVFIFKCGTRSTLQRLGVIRASKSTSAHMSAGLSHVVSQMKQRRIANVQPLQQSSSAEASDAESGSSEDRPAQGHDEESELPEFQCSICEQWLAVRDRPWHYRMHNVTPPPLRGEPRRAARRDLAESGQTRSRARVGWTQTSEQPTTIDDSDEGDQADMPSEDDESFASRPTLVLARTRKTTSRSSLAKANRGKRRRRFSTSTRNREKPARVRISEPQNQFDLPSDSDAGDIARARRSQSDGEEALREGGNSEPRVTAADPTALTQQDEQETGIGATLDELGTQVQDDGSNRVESGTGGATDALPRELQDRRSSTAALSGAGGTNSSVSQAQPGETRSPSVKVKKEEYGLLPPKKHWQAEETFRGRKQSFIMATLDKLKSQFYSGEDTSPFERREMNERIARIETLKRHLELLMNPDFDDADENDINFKQETFEFIQAMLEAFRDEIEQAGTGLWKKKGALKVLGLLKTQVENFARDERERSRARSLEGSAVNQAQVVLLDN